jgi:4-hydroxyacetophenone monooxygenase
MIVNTTRLRELAGVDLTQAVSQAPLPPLMAALACATGDPALLDFAQPAEKLINHFPAPHGGMTLAEQERARALCVAALEQLRDGSESLNASDPDRIEHALDFLQKFLMGPAAPGHIDLMRRELGVADLDRPEWTLEQYPDIGDFHVAVIGAGFAGLAMGYRLQQAGVRVTLLEKQDDVGGVWWQNRYPGCRLDTDNLAYSLSFAQSEKWAHQFSTRDDILGYLQEFAKESGLLNCVRLRTTVRSAVYSESQGTWTVVSEQDGTSRSEVFDAVVAACGSLNRPIIPDLPGLQDFEGVTVHTAEWPNTLDLRGKRVAVVGTGASAYQVVPAIAADVESLTLFQRSAPWMSPTPHYHEPIPAGHSALLRCVPGYAEWLRLFQVWNALEGRLQYARAVPDWTDPGSVSPDNKALRDALTQHIRQQYSTRPELADLAVPSYPPYGKRLLRDNGVWAQALQRANVRLVAGAAAKVEPHAIVEADGTQHEVDVIIFATGFDPSNFLPDLEVRGAGGHELHEWWKGEPRAYYGVGLPGFPNFFLSLGPNTGLVANGSLIFLAESAARYVVGVLGGAFERGMHSVCPTMKAFEEFNDGLDEENRQMAWGVEQSSNWYKNTSGRVTMVWPRPLIDYWRATREVETDDHEYSIPIAHRPTNRMEQQ